VRTRGLTPESIISSGRFNADADYKHIALEFEDVRSRNHQTDLNRSMLQARWEQMCCFQISNMLRKNLNSNRTYFECFDYIGCYDYTYRVFWLYVFAEFSICGAARKHKSSTQEAFVLLERVFRRGVTK
jgi:hypothetical protein